MCLDILRYTHQKKLFVSYPMIQFIFGFGNKLDSFDHLSGTSKNHVGVTFFDVYFIFSGGSKLLSETEIKY